MTIPPLRKKQLNGEPYTRPRQIEVRLEQVSQLSRDDVVALCEIPDRKHHDYVPSECLLHLVRQCRSDNSDRYFERLYKLLQRRILRALPAADSTRDNRTDLTRSKVREGAYDRFTEMLAKDRAQYDQRLDYFEVRFDGAVANLRRDASKPALRDQRRNQPIDVEEESGELSAKLELAARQQIPWDSPEISEEDYRLRLDQAIEQLPREQIRIIHMLRLGFPIDSKEEGIETIAKVLGKSEKTIRTHRDKAIATIQAVLKQGEDG